MALLSPNVRLKIGAAGFTVLVTIGTPILLDLPPAWRFAIAALCLAGVAIGATGAYAKWMRPERPLPPAMVEAESLINEMNVGEARTVGAPLVRTKRLGKFFAGKLDHQDHAHQ